MRKLPYLSCIAACFVGLGQCAFAADPARTGPLSLQDCIKVALQNQIDMLTAQTNVVTAKSRAVQAPAATFPSCRSRTTLSNGVRRAF